MKYRALQKQVEEKYVLARIELPASVRSAPTVANGVLFVATENILYAIGKKEVVRLSPSQP